MLPLGLAFEGVQLVASLFTHHNHPAAPPAGELAADAGDGTSGPGAEGASLPAPGLFDAFTPIGAASAGDPLAGALQAAVGLPSAVDPSRVATMLNVYGLPTSPTENSMLGAYQLLDAVLGQRHFAAPALGGGPLAAEDHTGAILDQSTGRFTGT